jgi:hypothetical protein
MSVVDLPRPCALICLCSRKLSSDDISSSLWMTRTTFPSPLLGADWGSAALATRGAYPRDLYTSGLVTPLDRCNADVIHRRHCRQ